MTSSPARGDLVWVSFDPQAGHEQAGRRPAIVLSPSAYNRRVGLVLVCPITRKIKGFPFEVVLPEGLPVHGAVLADQIKSLDWRARAIEHAGAAPARVVTEVLGKLTTLLVDGL